MIRYAAFSAVLVLLFSGCQKAPTGFPNVVPCRITVVKDGDPLPQTTVILVSDSPKEWFSSGETDASGKTEINTTLSNFSRSGAPEGHYKVTLNQIPQLKETKSQQELFDMPASEKAAYIAKQEKLIRESRAFPLEFESHVTTPIEIDVKKGEPALTIDVAQWMEK